MWFKSGACANKLYTCMFTTQTNTAILNRITGEMERHPQLKRASDVFLMMPLLMFEILKFNVNFNTSFCTLTFEV